MMGLNLLYLPLLLIVAEGSALYRTVLECEGYVRMYINGNTMGDFKDSQYYDSRVHGLDMVLLKMRPELGKDLFSALVWERLRKKIEVLQAPRIIKGWSKLSQEFNIVMEVSEGKVLAPEDYERYAAARLEQSSFLICNSLRGEGSSFQLMASGQHFLEFMQFGSSLTNLFPLGLSMEAYLKKMEANASELVNQYVIWPLLECIRHYAMHQAMLNGDEKLYERYYHISRRILEL